MSTPTFDLAIRDYPAAGGYEACRKLQQALDFDMKRNTSFEEFVHELVRRIVIQKEATGYVHVVPSTGDALPDLGHTTCTDGYGSTIDMTGGKLIQGHLHQFPNFYGVTEEAMDQLQSSGAVTVMRTARTGCSVPKSTAQFMWTVPPDAADILEASGQFKRTVPPDAADILEASGQFKRLTPQVPPAETGCTVSEPPPAPSEGPRHANLELALLLHIPEDLRPFFKISVTGTEDAALVSFGNHKGGSEEFRGRLDDVVAHVATLLDATVKRCNEAPMTMTCIPKEKP